MARYIDIDKAIAYLKGECVAKYPVSYCNGILASAKEISNLPSADVVPRGEVEKQLLKALKIEGIDENGEYLVSLTAIRNALKILQAKGE